MTTRQVSLKIELEDLTKIDEASKRTNRTRSNFLINAGLEKAKEVAER